MVICRKGDFPALGQVVCDQGLRTHFEIVLFREPWPAIESPVVRNDKLGYLEILQVPQNRKVPRVVFESLLGAIYQLHRAAVAGAIPNARQGKTYVVEAVGRSKLTRYMSRHRRGSRRGEVRGQLGTGIPAWEVTLYESGARMGAQEVREVQRSAGAFELQLDRSELAGAEGSDIPLLGLGRPLGK